MIISFLFISVLHLIVSYIVRHHLMHHQIILIWKPLKLCMWENRYWNCPESSTQQYYKMTASFNYTFICTSNTFKNKARFSRKGNRVNNMRKTTTKKQTNKKKSHQTHHNISAETAFYIDMLRLTRKKEILSHQYHGRKNRLSYISSLQMTAVFLGALGHI